MSYYTEWKFSIMIIVCDILDFEWQIIKKCISLIQLHYWENISGGSILKCRFTYINGSGFLSNTTLTDRVYKTSEWTECTWWEAEEPQKQKTTLLTLLLTDIWSDDIFTALYL